MPPYSTPPPKTSARTMDKEKKVIYAQILSCSSECGAKRLTGRVDLSSALCLRMAYLSGLIRQLGVPAMARGLPENLDRRQHPERRPWTAQTTGDCWRKAPPSRCTLNKCHLTLRKALAFVSPLWRNEDLLWIWAVGEAYLHSGRRLWGFHGCLPALVLFPAPYAPLGQLFFIFLTQIFTYISGCW